MGKLCSIDIERYSEFFLLEKVRKNAYNFVEITLVQIRITIFLLLARKNLKEKPSNLLGSQLFHKLQKKSNFNPLIFTIKSKKLKNI